MKWDLKNPPHLIKLIVWEEVPNLLDKHVLSLLIYFWVYLK